MGRKKFYETTDEMQADPDTYHKTDNHSRPHQGRGMNGRTPTKASAHGLPSREKPKKMDKPA